MAAAGNEREETAPQILADGQAAPSSHLHDPPAGEARDRQGEKGLLWGKIGSVDWVLEKHVQFGNSPRLYNLGRVKLSPIKTQRPEFPSSFPQQKSTISINLLYLHSLIKSIAHSSTSSFRLKRKKRIKNDPTDFQSILYIFLSLPYRSLTKTNSLIIFGRLIPCQIQITESSKGKNESIVTDVEYLLYLQL